MKYFLSLISIKKRIKYKRASIKIFIIPYNIQEEIVLLKDKNQQLYYIFLGSYSNLKQILMHENNYRQIYQKFCDPCSSQE